VASGDRHGTAISPVSVAAGQRDRYDGHSRDVLVLTRLRHLAEDVEWPTIQQLDADVWGDEIVSLPQLVLDCDLELPGREPVRRDRADQRQRDRARRIERELPTGARGGTRSPAADPPTRADIHRMPLWG
jgi:hypothetical protein